jgi:hypothetical protein
MNEIKEHQRVVLTVDLPAEKLGTGDVGTVVHIHQDGEALEVEFLNLAGKTVAVVSLKNAQVRAVET